MLIEKCYFCDGVHHYRPACLRMDETLLTCKSVRYSSRVFQSKGIANQYLQFSLLEHIRQRIWKIYQCIIVQPMYVSNSNKASNFIDEGVCTNLSTSAKYSNWPDKSIQIPMHIFLSKLLKLFAYPTMLYTLRGGGMTSWHDTTVLRLNSEVN